MAELFHSIKSVHLLVFFCDFMFRDVESSPLCCSLLVHKNMSTFLIGGQYDELSPFCQSAHSINYMSLLLNSFFCLTSK